MTTGTLTDLSGRDKPQRPAQSCFMDSGYHQAAIDEAAPARKL